MNVIFGVMRFDEARAGEDDLARMANGFLSASHLQRSLQTHCAGPIGMGRLTIGREVLPAPLASEGALFCTADARLYRVPGYNRPQDLPSNLCESVLCQLHSDHGDHAVSEIDGDFAYALWDENVQQLTLVRDHVGVRPIYYFHEPGKFLLFASHSDPIVQSGLIEDDLNLDTALANFVYDMSDVESTLVKGLKRLPAGHMLKATSSGGVAKRRYWELKCIDPIADNASFEECASTLRGLVTSAVEQRLPQNASIGAHLSGGLDSTAVSVLAARALQQESRPLNTYSFVSRMRAGVQFVDERPFADATVQSEPNIYNTKIAPPEEFADQVEGLRDRMAVFFGAEEKVLRAAQTDAVDVILSGWGGDEVVSFGGKGAYSELFLRGRWRLLWKEISARSAVTGASKRQVLISEVAADLFPEVLWNFLRRVAGRPEIAPAVNEMLIPMIKPAYRKALRDAPSLGANTRKNRLLRFYQGHVAYRLENWAMHGAHHGVRYAFPLLDRQLLEYAIRLPASFSKHDGLGRAIFREAMEDVLPESVKAIRQKMAPFPCNLLRLAEQRDEYLNELQVMRNNPRLTEIIDFDLVEQGLRQIPDVDIMKAAFNAEATGQPGPSMALTFAREPIIFLRVLQDRLGQ